MCLSTPHRSRRRARLATNYARWPDTREKLPASAPLDDEELFVIEGSPASTGAQLRDNPEEREKCGKTAKKALQ